LRVKTIHISIIVFIFVCGYTHKAALSQSLKDTLKLSEIEVKSSYSVKNYGFKRERIDSVKLISHLEADLSTILSEYSSIFIKSYGNGSLATSSFRGTTANHTEVEWNGISINSPMLGQSDLSQIPVSQFDGIEILYGSAGISKTSGAFGGVVNLVTTPEWNNRINLTLSQTIASFNTYATTANIALGNQNFQSVTKFNYSSSDNDFTYYNDYTRTEERQRNGAFDIGGITEELFLKLGKRNFLTGRIWYSQDIKDVPPITTNTDPDFVETLKDKALRSLVEWILLNPKSSFTVRSAFVDQFMNYKDATINANHEYYSLVNKIRYNYTGIRNFKIKPGLDFTYDWAYSDAYLGVKTRSTFGVNSEFEYDVSRKVELSFIFRQDVIDAKAVPFVPALGVNWRPFDKVNLALSGNLSKNYRYPTLNDLYWSQYGTVLGNPDLIAETDYTGEIGLTYHVNNNRKNFFIEAEASGYCSKMINLIEWNQVAGSSNWKPMNVREVLARGFDMALNLTYNVRGCGITLTNNYTFCKSTYQKETSPGDNSVGNQVIYVPVHLYNSTLTISYSGFSASYNFIYTSSRYLDRNNLSYMPGYYLSNIFIGKNIKFSNNVLSLQLQINNLFDLDYQSIASYPMPGINYGLTIRFNFKK
jgi:outer membrane cobalamin receptor